MNENEDITLKNLGNTVNIVLRRKFVTLNTYIRKKSQIIGRTDVEAETPVFLPPGAKS